MSNFLATVLAITIGFNINCEAQEPSIPAEVRENINSRVDNGMNTGIVVGIITSNGVNFYSYGVKSLKSKVTVDENTIFEIGSISKTFTGILLADMAVKGELKLDDPIQTLLPAGISAPTRNGESIKLFNLANHTSSLPRLPTNMNPANPANPYADYSEKQLYDFLNNYELPRDIGSEYEYSNYAVGLLGHLLAAKHQLTYEELMVKTICTPLGLTNTRISLTPSMKKNLAMGHSGGIEVENWDIPSLAGAGAIRSTAADMLKYLAANMGIEKSSLFPAMQLAHKNSRVEGNFPIVGLGWHTMVFDDSAIIWHNGGTGGYRTFAGFVKDGDKGVVVLSNSNTSVDDIGIHILHEASPLSQ
ncbi:serine hydrolase domain-containing protein [Sunxiuqinia sp. A32]|uniref:serine hydrolase domain-containing protein n=1 Tax=Sunxiuqinia sp. A32 TaxID=3461496 RepID=UPI004045EFBD